ncbi:hypothetical protein [Flavihumibacter sp.]|uniref:hypothetical protein n=1 Tax=Flavihumibacter sp. TaxID=1913981 RepID=UPI002FC9DB80
MKLFLLIIISVTMLNAFSQTKSPSTIKDENECKVRHPLEPYVFDRMIIQDITYAIAGENVPVSGLKIDVTKPEGTISGFFQLKKKWVDIISFDIKGGVTDRNFSIIKGYKNFNTSFEVRPSFHIIPANSGAMYGICDVAKQNTRILNAKNDLLEIYKANVVDSLYVITALRNRHLGDLTKIDSLPIINLKSKEDTIRLLRIFQEFLRKIKNDNEIKIPENETLMEAINRLNMAKMQQNDIDIAPESYNDLVQELYIKYKKHYKNLEEDVINRKISNASEIWTRKKYFWITFTPFARTEKITEYHTKYDNVDSLYFKSNHPFTYGVSTYLNWYVFYPKRKFAYLIRPGISLNQGNNLTNLSPFNYETRIPFFANGTAITEKIKSGTAYNKSEVRSGFIAQVHAEGYVLPMTDYFLPGLYASTSFNFSQLYKLPNIIGREYDKFQLMLEGGLVININSREKDKEKTILSILAYYRHEDLTDKVRTNILTQQAETRDDFRKRNSTLGIRVGIPINLPKR